MLARFCDRDRCVDVGVDVEIKQSHRDQSRTGDRELVQPRMIPFERSNTSFDGTGCLFGFTLHNIQIDVVQFHSLLNIKGWLMNRDTICSIRHREEEGWVGSDYSSGLTVVCECGGV